MQNKPNSLNVQMNVNIYYIKDYQNFIPLAGYKNKPNQTQFKPKTNPICRKGDLSVACPERSRMGRMGRMGQSLVKDLIALVKTSCAPCRMLLQCFSENFDKPGERKAECSARPKLRTDPMNLLGIMPAKEGKIDLKHSFYGSAFYFGTEDRICEIREACPERSRMDPWLRGQK